MRRVTPKRKLSREQVKQKKYKNAFRQQVMEDHELSYAARVLVYWLADYFDYETTAAHFCDTGEIVVYPAQKTLAKMTGCDQAEASRHIKSICKRDHLLIVHRGLYGSYGRRRNPNEYLVLLGDRKERRLQSERAS